MDKINWCVHSVKERNLKKCLIELEKSKSILDRIKFNYIIKFMNRNNADKYIESCYYCNLKNKEVVCDDCEKCDAFYSPGY